MKLNRRKALLGLGTLAAGGGAISTGAFTSVEADRDVTVSVANENNAYVAIEPSPTANGEFATQDSGTNNQLALDFSDSGNGGSGVGLSSVYEFDDVFRITNQGTQTVYVWANFSGGTLDDDDIWFYPDSNSEKRLNDGTNEVVALTVGETVEMGVHIDTNALSSTGNEPLTVTLSADVDVPSGSNPSDPSGEDAAVVSKSPDAGEFSSIQNAIDSVDGTTVYVESGTYQEDVLVDVDDLTLVGIDEDVVIESTGTGYQGEGDPVAPLEIVSKNVDIKNIAVQAVESESYGYGVQISGVSGASDVTLDGVRVDGSSGFNTGEFGTGVRVRGAPNTTLRNVIVNGGSDVDYGIRVQEPGTDVIGCTVNNCNRAIDVQSSDQTVRDNIINGITENSPGGFYKDPFNDGLEDDTFPSGKGIRVSTTPSGSNNTIENNEINDCALGIEAFGSDSSLLNNDLAGCSTGITVANGASNYTITNNTITDGSGRGISAFGGSTDAHTIEDNTVSNQGSGIVLSGADNNTLTGNTLTDNTYNGIWLNDGAGSPTGNDIQNNTVSNNGFGSGSPYPGIYLGGATDTSIEDNDINGNAAQGISVSNSTDTVIDGNTLEDNGEGAGDYIYSGMYIEGSEDLTITNNTLTDNYYHGIWVSGYSGNLTISGNDITLRDSSYQEIVTPSA